jgi:hypothetical protein
MCWSEGGVGRDYCQLPDFRLELPSPAGEPELRLAELKICGAVKKRKKAVGWRAALFTTDTTILLRVRWV